MSFRILIDADACPVKDIAIKIAKEFSLKVILVADRAHVLSDDYGEVVIVDTGRDSVDFALMKLLEKNDILVTQDYGLAALALGKGGKALNQNGLVFNNFNIDSLLMSRHEKGKARRAAKPRYGKGQGKRTKEMDQAFKEALLQIIDGNK